MQYTEVLHANGASYSLARLYSLIIYAQMTIPRKHCDILTIAIKFLIQFTLCSYTYSMHIIQLTY